MDSEWQESALRRGLTQLVKFWVPKVVVCCFIYFLSVRVIGDLVNGLAFLSAKSGSVELWQTIHQHSFARSILVGLIAGSIPMNVWLAISGSINSKFEDSLHRLRTEKLKPWLWVVFRPFILVAPLQWTSIWYEANHRNASVLSPTSRIHLSEFVRGFLTTDCSANGGWPMEPWETATSFRCRLNIQIVSLWLLAAGNSAVPIMGRTARSLSIERRAEPDDAGSEKANENTMEEKTDKQ
jgi:hypothetical protein